jgi:hypothetical protein
MRCARSPSAREAARAHPWFVDLLVGRQHLGQALAHLSCRWLHWRSTGLQSIDFVMDAVGTVNAYVIGALRGEAGELRAELERTE